MSIKEDYYVKQITYNEAMDIVTQHHYLHRKSSCSFAFGLFKYNSDKEGMASKLDLQRQGSRTRCYTAKGRRVIYRININC